MIDYEDDASLIRSGNWPLGSLLPVKKYLRRGEAFGVIRLGEPTRVYSKNLLDFRTGTATPQLEDVVHLDYTSVEELVADGWIVD